MDSHEVMLKYCRKTKTTTGLRVNAHMASKLYRTGEGISNKQMNTLPIERKNNLSPMELQYLAARNQTEENAILFLSGCLAAIS